MAWHNCWRTLAFGCAAAVLAGGVPAPAAATTASTGVWGAGGGENWDLGGQGMPNLPYIDAKSVASVNADHEAAMEQIDLARASMRVATTLLQQRFAQSAEYRNAAHAPDRAG